MKRLRMKFGVSEVLAGLALFVALGIGTAWAAGLAPNSVKSKHIKDGQVKSVDLKDDAVTGVDVRESTLAQVPAAETADTAADAALLDGREASEYARAASEDWQPLGLYSNPALCHFVNYGGNHNPAGFYRDSTGTVHLRGTVKAVDGTTENCSGAFDELLNLPSPLPEGYRPSGRTVFPIVSNNKPGRVDVTPNGLLILEPNYPAWADAKQWFTLDGISFRCAPAGANGCP